MESAYLDASAYATFAKPDLSSSKVYVRNLYLFKEHY